jgi:hypothetical protein
LFPRKSALTRLLGRSENFQVMIAVHKPSFKHVPRDLMGMHIFSH